VFRGKKLKFVEINRGSESEVLESAIVDFCAEAFCVFLSCFKVPED
jgi:hypothetical protein